MFLVLENFDNMKMICKKEKPARLKLNLKKTLEIF